MKILSLSLWQCKAWTRGLPCCQQLLQPRCSTLVYPWASFSVLCKSITILKACPCHSRSISWVAVVATSAPVLNIQEALLKFHDVTHLPWWASIVITTFAIRFILTFPLAIYQNYVLARYARIQPEIIQIAKELKLETAAAIKLYGWDEKQARFAYNLSLRKQIRLLIERDNCHPLKSSLVVWIQIPVWISVSFALRNLCSEMPNLDIAAHVTFLELSNGGFLWIPNLTFPDTSLLFPVLFSLLNLIIIEIHANRTLKHTRFQKVLTNFLRGITIVMIPVAASVPSCLVLYWTTSSVLGLSQNLMLMSPQFRNWCNIPAVDGESRSPFRDVMNNFKKALSNKFGN